MNFISKYNFCTYIFEIEIFIDSSCVKILLGIDSNQSEFFIVFDNEIIGLNVLSPNADNQKYLTNNSVALCRSNVQKSQEHRKLIRISI